MGLAEQIEKHHRALTVNELAGIIGLAPRTIRDRVANGSIPAFKIGAAIRFDPKAVATWLRGQVI
jgi:excisionase family DNA binding protein